MTALFIKVLKKNSSIRHSAKCNGGLVRRSFSEGGATMIESAFGMALFLFLILCLFSILWTSYQYVVAQFLATEAVRELQVLPGDSAGRATAIRNALTCGAGVDARLRRLCSQNYALRLNLADVQVDLWNGGGWVPGAGGNGDFVRVTINVTPLAHRIVSGNTISLGGGLQYNQNFAMRGEAIGRNEAVVQR